VHDKFSVGDMVQSPNDDQTVAEDRVLRITEGVTFLR